MSGALDAQAPLSPREALGVLKAGNDRFARNASSPVSTSINRRREIAPAQHPIAIVLSCADSRVPPEYVFNAGLGDLFVIRTAGEVIDRSILATIEYGADHGRRAPPRCHRRLLRVDQRPRDVLGADLFGPPHDAGATLMFKALGRAVIAAAFTMPSAIVAQQH
jgi:hypothetical protein